MNSFRGLVVEAIVAEALEPDWKWVSSDWSSWDFEHQIGLRLEVKQSAALQSWHTVEPKRWLPRFDINDRTGRWEGANWLAEEGRSAQIYVFATHDLTDAKIADHRNPSQWDFYVIDERSLPRQKTIGFSGIRQLAKPCKFRNLHNTVNAVSSNLSDQ